MATKSKRHTHKYYRNEITPGTRVWACALGDCNHFMPPHYEKLVNGKNSICWKCGDLFVLDILGTNRNQEKPFCLDCTLTTQFKSDEEPKQPETQTEVNRPICAMCKKNPVTGASHLCMSCFLNS